MPLSEIMGTRLGSIDPSRYPDETFELYSIPSYDAGNSEVLLGSEIGSAKQILNPGDVLISKIVPHIRRTWVVSESKGYRILGSGEWIVFRNDCVDKNYLRLILKSDPFHREFMKTVSGIGGSLLRARPSSVASIKIPLPPLDQKRIAHLLGKVEGLIAQRKQHLQQLDALLKSVFLEMFGDPIINPKQFRIRRLSEFYVNPKEGTKCGPFGSALKKDEVVDFGVPVWNMDNIGPSGQMIMPFRMWITKEKYEELSAYEVLDGDIVISRAGTVGKMCVARMNGSPAIISTNLIRVRLGHELLPLHFVSLMLYCKGRVGRLKTGADGTFTHMNTGVLDSLEFPYPPIDLQNQFAAIVDKVEGIKSRYQQSLGDLEALYGALSQKAFAGELDLSRVPFVTVDGQKLATV